MNFAKKKNKALWLDAKDSLHNSKSTKTSKDAKMVFNINMSKEHKLLFLLKHLADGTKWILKNYKYYQDKTAKNKETQVDRDASHNPPSGKDWVTDHMRRLWSAASFLVG